MSSDEHADGVPMAELDRRRLQSALDELRTLSRETLEGCSNSLAEIAISLGQTGDGTPDTCRALICTSRILYVLAFEGVVPDDKN